MRNEKNTKNFTPISDELFLRLACYQTLIKCLSVYININIMFNIYTSLILHSHKKSARLSMNCLFSCPKKSFSSQQTLQLNVYYSNTLVLTFRLYDCQDTKSNRCNQIEVLLQRDFKLKSLNKKLESFKKIL